MKSKRHVNPDGSIGGLIIEPAIVSPYTYVCPDSIISGKTVVYGSIRIVNSNIKCGIFWTHEIYRYIFFITDVVVENADPKRFPTINVSSLRYLTINGTEDFEKFCTKFNKFELESEYQKLAERAPYCDLIAKWSEVESETTEEKTSDTEEFVSWFENSIQSFNEEKMKQEVFFASSYEQNDLTTLLLDTSFEGIFVPILLKELGICSEELMDNERPKDILLRWERAVVDLKAALASNLVSDYDVVDLNCIFVSKLKIRALDTINRFLVDAKSELNDKS